MTAATVQQLVTFRMGEDHFAVDILEVERVLRFSPPVAVPNLPTWMDGVIDHGGRVVPVINLRSRFGMPRLAPRPEHRILVLTIGEEWLGVTVDSVHEVLTVSPDEIAPPPPIFRGLNAEYLKGLVRSAGLLLIFLDVARVLTSSELLELTSTAVSHG